MSVWVFCGAHSRTGSVWMMALRMRVRDVWASWIERRTGDVRLGICTSARSFGGTVRKELFFGFVSCVKLASRVRSGRRRGRAMAGAVKMMAVVLCCSTIQHAQHDAPKPWLQPAVRLRGGLSALRLPENPALQRRRRREKLRNKIANFELRDHTFWYAVVVIYMGYVAPAVFLPGLEREHRPAAGTRWQEREALAAARDSVAEEGSTGAVCATSTPSEARNAFWSAKRSVQSGTRSGSTNLSRFITATYDTLVKLRPLVAAASITLLVAALCRAPPPDTLEDALPEDS